MIEKQELEAILKNGHFETNLAGINIAKSHLELYDELEKHIEFVYRELDKLRHFRDSSVGAWCTDRSDLVREKINDPGFFATFFWELKD